MDKRFVTFLMLTMLIFVGYLQLRMWMNPPVDPEEQDPQQVAQNEQPQDEGPRSQNNTGGAEPVDPPDPDDPAPEDDPPASDENSAAALRKNTQQQWVTLGSVDPDGDYRLLLTFNNRGATLERAELSSPKYHDLEDEFGYFGHLALTDADGGAKVQAVGDGTPAARAKPVTAGAKTGLQVGDVIVEVDGEKVASGEGGESYAAHAAELLHSSAPGDEVTVKVARGEGAAAKTLTYIAELAYPPLQVIQPERFSYLDETSPLQELSFLTTLSKVGNIDKSTSGFSRREIDRIPSLFESNWVVEYDEAKPDEVAFSLTLDEADLKDLANAQPLKITKRFRLAKIDEQDDTHNPAYHVTMNVEVQNLGEESTNVALEQRGPTGLPLEGFWYVRKGTPDWGGAGARDVVYREVDGKNKLHRLPVIYDHAEEEETTALFTPDDFGQNPVTRYVGVDTQYFAAVMIPDETAAGYSPEKYRFKFGEAISTSERHKKWKSTMGVSFRVMTDGKSIPAGGSFEQQYTVFIGPKDPLVLQPYELEDTIVFGWSFFGAIAKILLVILHYIQLVVRNYGIAIILLTVLVRLAVLPIGRKQAQNAAKMQELAPEMKAIAEKHKDMEARAKAQQELFRRHNYHPLGGCWMMFLQLPIFFGLYKALSTSIELRQESLIPGLKWCSNLAGPDMLFRWDSFMPAFLAAENGFLGPYFNILPLVTIALFIVQQKLFTPPPTDAQQRMQQSMMKYMMVFMGFLFFKVPSGLCLYFIVSALWSIAERKLLPKPKPKGGPIPAKDDDGKAEKKEKPKAKPKTKAELKENSLVAMVSNMLNKPEETNGDGSKGKRRPKRKKNRK